ncbi:MAG: aspartyl/asparaginyl beta-hydroxylase domain-containing protein [Flavobacteriaceae bacterium]
MSSASIQLNKTFDKNLLQEAYRSLSHIETKPANYPGAGSISWNSLSVYAAGGSLESLESILPFIAELNLQLRLVRFLDLGPGGVIKEHSDTFLSGRVVRLHIPVFTNPKVEFNLAHKRQYWQEGEFWYGDFTMPHSVYNKGDATRVHLVIDAAVDENLLKLFNPGTIPAKLYDSLKTEEKFNPEILERFKCDFWMPAGFTLPGSGYPPLESDLVANLKLMDGEFTMFVNDAPMVKAVPVTENKLLVLGLPHEMFADYKFENDKVKSLTFHMAGRSMHVTLVER